MTHGETIRDARIRKGLSQNKLSKLVGVTRPCVHYWEADHSYPRPASAARIEALLDVALPPNPNPRVY